MRLLLLMDILDRELLEKVYNNYNKREYVHPDPLEFLYKYDDPREREIVALLASSLAYGRVTQILKSVRIVLDIMGDSPSRYLAETDHDEISGILRNFKHRFTDSEEITSLLSGIKDTINDYGSLYNCFISFYNDDLNILKPLTDFVEQLKKNCCKNPASLIPDPQKGSACKRLNLFLRWMIRRDDVDPGGWDAIPASALIVPLDTHMHRFSLEAGLTERKSNDIRTALEITEGFKKFCHEDPVKYDFSITRYGIRDDISWEEMRNELFK
jgi:uncharacterized protein (TIGR02757 family)